MALSRRDRFGLGLQRTLGWVFFPILGNLAVAIMRLGLGYRILNLRQLRKKVLALIGHQRAPLLICANHLTLIDSALIGWTLSSNWRYMSNFWLFPWNLPEKRNYASNPLLRLVCYLFKCVHVERRGPPEKTKRTMEKLRYLLNRKEALFIFPEGTRSRSGRVNTEEFAYGVGRLCKQVPGTKVLCVYQRGQHQEKASNLPRRNEVFYTDVALIQPTSEASGPRADRQISTQIVQKLYEMEQAYFEHAAGRQ